MRITTFDDIRQISPKSRFCYHSLYVLVSEDVMSAEGAEGTEFGFSDCPNSLCTLSAVIFELDDVRESPLHLAKIPNAGYQQ